MSEYSRRLLSQSAVCEIHLEQGLQDIVGLGDYKQALAVLRLEGTVVGQVWLGVQEGRIAKERIISCLPAVAWPVWMHVVQRDSKPAQPLPTASVIVCTRDRTADLAQCLPGLSKLATQDYEVIIVDNSPSDDATKRLVATYPEIHYLREPRPGLNTARNHGLLAASGEIVAFTDDDAVVDSGWLPALLRGFEDPLVAVVTGITMPAELETPAQIWFERTNAFGRGFVRLSFDAANTNILATGRVGAGVNMAIRRDATNEIGLFSQALDGGTPTRSGGDQEFFYRVLARGYRICYEPAALVWHRHRREWAALRQTIYGYGVGVFAWWTQALLVERELTLIKKAPSWLLQHHVRNLFRALTRRRGHVPRDLAWAEFLGALLGPVSYLYSRSMMRKQVQPEMVDQPPSADSYRASARATDPTRVAADGQRIEAQ